MNKEYRLVVSNKVSTLENSRDYNALLFLCREQEDLDLLYQINKRENEQKFRKSKSYINKNPRKAI